MAALLRIFPVFSSVGYKSHGIEPRSITLLSILIFNYSIISVIPKLRLAISLS
jgi:hypothetical protein